MEAINATKKERESGVELLKIIGIFLVALSHVVQTLTTQWGGVDSSGFFVDLSQATTDISTLVILILRHSGALGNAIFFTCSAWFLVKSEKTNFKKILNMILDIFVVSICWLIPMFAVYGSSLGWKSIIKSLLPTYFGNNWYLTTYILFCLIYPFLNAFIQKTDRKTHFLLAVGAVLVFIVAGMVKPIYGSTFLLIFAAVYLMVSYIQKYNMDFADSKKSNLIILFIGIFGGIAAPLTTNFLGLKISFLSSRILYFNGGYNIFFWMIAYAALNLFRQLKIKSKFINFSSSLSLLIYVIHENLLCRKNIRPAIWDWIHINLNQNLTIVWIFAYTAVLFVASYLVATLYTVVLKKLVAKISNWIYSVIEKLCNWFYKLVSKDEQ